MRMYSVVAWCTFCRRVPSDFGALLEIRAMLLLNCDVYCESHFLRPNMHLLQYPAQSRATTSYFVAFETLFKSILDIYTIYLEVLWHFDTLKIGFSRSFCAVGNKHKSHFHSCCWDFTRFATGFFNAFASIYFVFVDASWWWYWCCRCIGSHGFHLLEIEMLNIHGN